MAIKVDWTVEAEETFSNILDYLQKEWSLKEIEKFVKQTDQVIKRIQLFPESYPPGHRSTQYRRARLNKHIVLFYKYYKTKKHITLLTFWNTKQDPAKLKY